MSDSRTDALALAFARAMLPAGRVLPAGDERSAAAALRFAADIAPAGPRAIRALLELFEQAARAYAGRPFSRLDRATQDRLLARWQGEPVLARALFLLAFVFKAGHFDHGSVYEAMGAQYVKGGPAEPARWLAQVRRGDELPAGEALECDAVVVGSGAGGAVVAKELADRGYAVVIIEEGALYRRDAFRGSPLAAKRRFYRGKAAIAAVGNAVIPTFMGRLVGGSTAINTATCWRTPAWILERWCDELGTDALSSARLAPHFGRVERFLGVAPVPDRLLGGLARVVARGCDRLGWKHGPVERNAPDCDGQGVCDFGCPSGGRRGMDASYVPAALARSALLVTGTRAEQVLIERGRAVGVVGRVPGSDRTLRVRAPAVVLSGGAVPSPLLLLRQGIGNRSGQVGRNLSLHPACSLTARFEEPVGSHVFVPQDYCCSEFHRDGILLLGATAPLSMLPLMLPMLGRELTGAVERYDRHASLGVMVEDHTRGRVRLGRGGEPRLSYWLTPVDLARLHRGLEHAAELFFAAGALEVYPTLVRGIRFARDGGLGALRRLRLRPWDLVLISFHPLGTCRMGTDPRRSVVGLDHQSHDVPGLFVVDGSSLPGPPAVNPQLTIMAMADRAAGLIAERLG
jgi:choline dehydrogenase-like flavoprotein